MDAHYTHHRYHHHDHFYGLGNDRNCTEVLSYLIQALDHFYAE